MKELFENWREFRKEALNEQRPELKALQDIEQNPDRWSHSIEDAKRAARERTYGVTTSQRPLAASKEARDEEDVAKIVAGMAGTSLVAMYLYPVIKAALAGQLARQSARPAGDLAIPEWMSNISPDAGAFMKWLFPSPFLQHVITALANVAKRLGWFSAVSSLYMLIFLTVTASSKILAADALVAWIKERMPWLYDQLIKRSADTINEILADALSDILVKYEGTPQQVEEKIKELAALQEEMSKYDLGPEAPEATEAEIERLKDLHSSTETQ
jgi:hypothetical protein